MESGIPLGSRNPESQERVEFRSKIPQSFWIPVPFSVVILQHLCYFIGCRKSLPNLVYLAKGFQSIGNEGFLFSMDDNVNFFFVLQLSSKQHVSSVLKLRTSAYFVRIPLVKYLVHLKINATQLRDTQRFSSDPINLLLQP